MAQNLIRSMVYISTAKAGLREADFSAIADSAQRNNRTHDITGLLVFNGINFMQLLEGTAESVNNCMAVIAADCRHDGLVIVAKRDKNNREFPDWDMASRVIGTATTAYADMNDILKQDDVEDETRQLFRNFSRLGMPRPG